MSLDPASLASAPLKTEPEAVLGRDDDDFEAQLQLYSDREVKEEEMVIGPTVICRPAPGTSRNSESGHCTRNEMKKNDRTFEQLIKSKVVLQDVADELFCKVCSKWSLTAAELASHKQTHCTTVSSTAAAKSDWSLNRNCKVVLQDVADELFCKVCSKWSLTAAELASHKKTHCATVSSTAAVEVSVTASSTAAAIVDWFVCKLCWGKFTNQSALTQHLRKRHKKRSSRNHFVYKQLADDPITSSDLEQLRKKQCLSCDQCAESFSCQKDWLQHKHIHKDINQFACDQSNKRFKQKSKSTRLFHEEKQLICDYCGKWFMLKSNLIQHMKDSHHEKVLFACDLCDERFTQKKNLSQHKPICVGKKPKSRKSSNCKINLKKHSTEKLFACDQCGKCFWRKCRLTEHKNTHSGERPFACDHCEKRYSNKSTLVDHMRIHIDKGAYACDQCGKKHKDRSSLNHHKALCGRKNPFVCDHCNKHFSRRFSLVNHTINFHNGVISKPSKQKPLIASFACDQCDERFTQEKNLTQHKPICVGKKPESRKSSNCKINSKKYSTEKLFACDQCHRSFVREFALTKHKNIHKLNLKKPFACDQCGKCFWRKCRLTEHKNTHSGVRPFACDHCEKRYSNKSTLVDHKRIHTDKGAYACDQCGKKHKDRSSLNHHKALCGRKNPFVCDHCNKHFTRRFCLVNHTINFHNGVISKPLIASFACDQCDERFAYRSGLYTHKYVHSKKRPHACDQCPKSFARPVKLAKHKETHRRMGTERRPYACDQCHQSFKLPGKLAEHKLLTHSTSQRMSTGY